MRHIIIALAAIALLAASSGQLRADIATFDFPDSLLGATTPFSMTNNGVTAHFSSPADPGAFFVSDTFFSFPNHVLLDPGPTDLTNIPLKISFSRLVTSVSMLFALRDTTNTTTLDLDAFKGTSEVGRTSASGTIPAGLHYSEGTLSFSGGLNNIVLTSGAPDFAVADIMVHFSTISTIPEPSSLVLAGSLGLGLLAGALATSQVRLIRKDRRG